MGTGILLGLDEWQLRNHCEMQKRILAFAKKTVALTFLAALAHVLLPAQLLNYCDIGKQAGAGCVDKENNLGSPCSHS